MNFAASTPVPAPARRLYTSSLPIHPIPAFTAGWAALQRITRTICCWAIAVPAARYFPRFYVTGRLATDTVNTMEFESQAYAGLNSQVNLTNYAYGYRWGDYTSMMVDTDDCTFWYTGE